MTTPNADRYAPCRELLRVMALIELEHQEQRQVPALDRTAIQCLRAALALDPSLAPRVRGVVLRAVLFARALLCRPPAAVQLFYRLSRVTHGETRRAARRECLHALAAAYRARGQLTAAARCEARAGMDHPAHAHAEGTP